jgi:outer membrane protein TolC
MSRRGRSFTAVLSVHAMTRFVPRLSTSACPFTLAGFVPRAVVLATLLVISGCAIQPKAVQPKELARLSVAAQSAAQQRQVPVQGPVPLDEAIARALKYNLDHRSRLMEEALASGQLEAGRFDMLPRLLANAGYSTRDNDNVRRSADPANPSAVSTSTPFISSERNHYAGDLGLSWNVLDFGASYYTAKQNADRLLIASERRRKAMHALIQNVRTTYWRALAAQSLGQRVQVAIDEAEQALGDARRVAEARVRSPGEVLRYQRNLLENLRLLESLQRELASARIELALLIGAEPGATLVLVEPAEAAPKALLMKIEAMEAQALTQNADLRENFYNVRLATADTRKALLRLMPGISFDYAVKRDTDRYLVNQQWQEAGWRVSYNLLNLLSAPSQMRAAEAAEKVQEVRRLALQMTVLTQVHLAYHQYDDALRQYQRSLAIHEVDGQLAELARSQELSQMAGRMDRISANVTGILSAARRYQAMARVQEAGSRVQATLGLEPEIGNLDDTDLPTLQQAVGKSLQRWANGQGAL